MNGKSDTLDAENAARAVLAGYATAIPKTADGSVEMIRQLKIAHDTAVKARAATMVTLKAVLVHAPDKLRHAVARKTPVMLARHLAALRPRGLETPEDASRHTLRSLARRWQYLQEEAHELEGMSTGRHRINYGGHRQLNAAIYRTVIVRMRFHEPTIAYVARRTAEGKYKRDIIRCLKRYVIREVYHLIRPRPVTGRIRG